MCHKRHKCHSSIIAVALIIKSEIMLSSRLTEFLRWIIVPIINTSLGVCVALSTTVVCGGACVCVCLDLFTVVGTACVCVAADVDDLSRCMIIVAAYSVVFFVPSSLSSCKSSHYHHHHLYLRITLLYSF